MHDSCVFTLLNWLCAGRIRLGWTHAIFTIAYHMLMHFHAYVPYILFILIYWLYLVLFYVSLSLSLLFTLVASWHLNVNLLHLGTLFVLGHPLLLTPLPLMSGSMMRRPNQTSLRNFLDKAFIRNAKSFCQTSLTLIFPLSSTVGNGGHCVTSRSPVHPCQHAWIWFFSTSLYYSHLRYANSGHSGYCIWCASRPQGSTSWLPWLWSS